MIYTYMGGDLKKPAIYFPKIHVAKLVVRRCFSFSKGGIFCFHLSFSGV